MTEERQSPHQYDLGKGQDWEIPVPEGFARSVSGAAQKQRSRVVLVSAVAAVTLVVAASGLGIHYGASSESPLASPTTITTDTSSASIIPTSSLPSPEPSGPTIQKVELGGITKKPGWILASPVTQAAAVPADTAVHAAEDEVRGDLLQHSHFVKASLALATDSETADGLKSILPLKGRLVWVLEINDVQLSYTNPGIDGDSPHPYLATIQWLMDASTGKYIEARDFAQ